MDIKKDYCNKTAINLAYKDRKKGNDPRLVLPLAVIVIAAVVSFGKFMVSDKLNEAARVNAEIDSVRQQTESYREKNKEYTEVKDEYGSFSKASYSMEELMLTDITDVLDIVDKKLLNGADISTYVFNSNVLNVVLTDVTLKEVASLVSGLYESDIVTGVTVSTATTGTGEQVSPDQKVTATVSISLGMELSASGGGASK
ncbi:hypothetical protein MUJ63_07310 [Lachnospiraceae bacterium NSJ-143]|nr:hypothetical protein [Lachnospiraceae bacterium NSJ-143]